MLSLLKITLRTSLLTMLCLAGITLLGQDFRSSWSPTDYYGIPGRDKQNAFFDEFENNRHAWNLGQSYLQEEIRDGDFYIATMTSHAYTKRRSVPMNQTGNYEIELRLRYMRGDVNGPLGLTFGRDIRGNEYNLLFTPDGNFRISEYRDRRRFDLMEWQRSRSLTKYSYNSLMVRKVADRWYFFINQELVGNMPARELFGNEFGFTIGGNMAAEVDYLRVSEIRTVDNTGPEITLIEPVLANGTALVPGRTQTVKGRVYDVSGISEVNINGTAVHVAPDGTFMAELRMREAYHSVEISAADRYHNRSMYGFTVRMERPDALASSYQPVPQTAPYSNRLPPGYGQSYQRPSGLNELGGKNYILLIGINQYDYWNQLHNAVKDCSDLADVLTSGYQFEPENVMTLFNQDATRENILEKFEELQDKIGPNDNLLIYYAGHGFYDEQANLGYWVPANARLNKIPDFVRNSTIHDYLRTINSHHTLLIADACYAGSLFAHARGVVNEANRSRWAFTSGDIEKVWDGQPGDNSPFARYLIRYLLSTEDQEIRADQLIKNVRAIVERNTAQSPQGNALSNVGDEGGVFVFRRR